MTFIPDTRNDNAYNQDFLTDMDKMFIRGYNYAMETISNFILYNLDTYEGELNELCPDGHEEEPDESFSKREDLYEILEENKNLIECVISHWLNAERDEIITSFIDNMNDEEYEKIKAEAIKSGKEYYDTRHYAITGEKIDHNKESEDKKDD